MNYSIRDIENLAYGIYPKRCILASNDPICRLDEGLTCNFCGSSKEDCVGWREVNIFNEEKLAKDIIKLRSFINPILLNLIYKENE